MKTKTPKYFDLNRILKQKNPRLYRFMPRFVVRIVEAILMLRRHNEIMAKYGHLEAFEFIDRSLEYIGVKYEVHGLENIPDGGKLLFAANHPLGGIDGMILATVISKIRPDVRLIVNDILLNIEPLRPIFVGVNKHGVQRSDLRTDLDEMFQQDYPIINFAAGLCSRRVGGEIVDPVWKHSFVSRCVSSGRLVVPTFVDARNSGWFYFFARLRKFLGIGINLEMALLPRQIYFQRGRTVHIHFGVPVLMDGDRSARCWSEDIRSRVYDLASAVKQKS